MYTIPRSTNDTPLRAPIPAVSRFDSFWFWILSRMKSTSIKCFYYRFFVTSKKGLIVNIRQVLEWIIKNIYHFDIFIFFTISGVKINKYVESAFLSFKWLDLVLPLILQDSWFFDNFIYPFNIFFPISYFYKVLAVYLKKAFQHLSKIFRLNSKRKRMKIVF